MGDVDDPSDEAAARIEPASPSLENTVFVLLGVMSTLLVVYHMVTLFM